MTVLAHDIEHKAREAAQLPSVDEWIRSGGQVERVSDPPRREAVMAGHGETRS